MEFHWSRKGKYCILHIQGESMAIEEKERLNQEITAFLAKESLLAVEVSRLKYANSQLLGQFLIAFKAMERKKGRFAVIGAKGSVRDLLRITAMDRVFLLYEDMKTFEKAM